MSLKPAVPVATVMAPLMPSSIIRAEAALVEMRRIRTEDILLPGKTMEEWKQHFCYYQNKLLGQVNQFDNIAAFLLQPKSSMLPLLDVAYGGPPGRNTRSSSSTELPFDPLALYMQIDASLRVLIERSLPAEFMQSQSFFSALAPLVAANGSSFALWDELALVLDTPSAMDRVHNIQDLLTTKQTTSTVAAFNDHVTAFNKAHQRLLTKYKYDIPSQLVLDIFMVSLHSGMASIRTPLLLRDNLT